VTFPIVPDLVEILYMSGSHDDEYAIVLRVRRGTEWDAIASVDNSHERAGVDAHHLHRYAGGVKGDPQPLPFAVVDSRDARAKVIRWMTDNWEELSSG